ncbi:MAG: hemolysin family protein [Halobacteriales archaeon]
MLQRLLRFRNRIVKETMVPRRDVVAVEAATDLETAIETCIERGVIRLPVYEDVLDTVVGVVHVLDLIEAHEREEPPSLRAIATDPHVVPESKEVDDLLVELRAERRRMAVVVDEFGATAGIVTIEDIVEEIIGEVLAERESPPIRWLDGDTALVRGELNVHAANEALGTDLPEAGEFESMAGLLLDRAGQLPGEGESVTDDGIRLTAETVENNRFLEIRIELGTAGATAEGNDGADDGEPTGGSAGKP